MIILGDMDIDLFSCMTSLNAQKLMNVLNGVNITQVISGPTRVTSRSCTLIGHVYASPSRNIPHISAYGAGDQHFVCITRKLLCKADANVNKFLIII